MKDKNFENDSEIVKQTLRGDINKLQDLITETNINIPARNGLSLLAIAAFKNNMPLIKFLIKKGANIKACPMEGPYKNETALFLAAALHGNKEIVQLLIDNGASFDELTQY